MRVALSMIALSTLLMAGCTEPAATLDDVATDSSELVALPSWAIGDWWTYRFMSGDEITWVVTGEEGADWILDVDSASLAFHHAAFDEVSTIGRVSKAHLAGSQEDGSVKLLDFPLTLGKSWPLQWDHEPYTAEVVNVGAAVRIEYSQNGVVSRTIDYDPAFGWIKNLQHVSAEGGNTMIAQGLRQGGNYAGEYYRYEIHAGHEAQDGGMGSTSYATFQVPEVATGLHYSIQAACNPDGVEEDRGVYGYRVDNPSEGASEPQFAEIWNCPDGGEYMGTWEEPVPGEWSAQGFYGGGSVNATFLPFTQHLLSLT